MATKMKNLKKKLEERTKLEGWHHLVGGNCIKVKNKDLLQAVLPLLREINKQALVSDYDEIRIWLDFIEELLEGK